MNERRPLYVAAIVDGFGGPSLSENPRRSIGMDLVTGEADDTLHGYVPLTKRRLRIYQEHGMEPLDRDGQPHVKIGRAVLKVRRIDRGESDGAAALS